MSIDCFEAYNSPSKATLGGEIESLELLYTCIGTDSEIAVVNAVLAATAATYNGKTTQMTRGQLQVSKKAYEHWEIIVPYETDAAGETTSEPPQELNYEIDMQTGFEMVNMTKSLAIVDENSHNGAAPPNRNLAIGFDGKKVNGVNVPVPKQSMNVTITFNPGFITQRQCAKWSRYVGYKNSDNWLGYAAGELRYLGNNAKITLAMFRNEVKAPVQVKFQFEISPNQAAPYFVDGIQMNSPRQGWDYVDVQYEKSEDGGALVPKILYVYVHRLSESISYGSLFLIR